MTDITFEINFGSGFVTVAPPVNWKAIEIELIFNSPDSKRQLNSINFEWVGDTAKKINAYMDGGVTGQTNGAYECLPLRVKLCGSSISFSLMLDLVNQSARFECDRVICPIVEEGRADWFDIACQKVTFHYLASMTYKAISGPGAIYPGDYKLTPYCISSIPNNAQVAYLFFALLILFWSLYQAIYDFYERTYTLIGSIGDIVDYASIAVNIILLIIQLMFIVLIINQIIVNIKAMINEIIQSKKYKLCMREADLFLKLTAFLGLTFTSSIFGYANSGVVSDGYGGRYVNATWMPQKTVTPTLNQTTLVTFDRPEDEAPNGIPAQNSYGHFDGTGKEFIDAMLLKYNAERRVDNGVLYFEPKHILNVQGAFQMPNTAEIGNTFNLPAPHGINAFELASELTLLFPLDNSDLNTIHIYRGTSVQVLLVPNSITNKKNVLLGKGIIIEMPCALAKRKDYFTRAENKIEYIILITQAFRLMLSVMVGGTYVPAPSPIAARLGWMLLSNDSFSLPKTFIGTQVGNDWEIDTASEANMSAIGLLNDFHGLELATRGNQYEIYYDKKIPFCCDGFQKVNGKNVFVVPNTTLKGKFDKLKWNLQDDIAENIDYRIQKNWTNNLHEVITIDGNQ